MHGVREGSRPAEEGPLLQVRGRLDDWGVSRVPIHRWGECEDFAVRTG